MINSLSDTQLLDRYKNQSDKNALGILFKRYSHLLFGLCFKYLKNEAESKDAVMQIFEKLIKDLNKHEVQNFKSWIYTVGKNHCLMILRSKKRELEKSKEYKLFSENNVETEPDLHLNYEEKLDKLEQGMKSLNKEQYTCIDLFYLQQKSYKEVTKITGFNLKEVKSYIQNGKRNLKNFLIQKHETKSA